MGSCSISYRGGRCTMYRLVCRGGSVCFPISSCLCDHMIVGALFVVVVSDQAVSPNVYEGLGGVEALLGMGIYQRPYMNRLIPAPSYYCGRRTLILCAGTLDPWMHRWVELTKVMTILLLIYPQVLEYGCCHFFARRLAILLKLAAASTPSSPSTEVKKNRKMSTLLETCLQVHFILCPFCLLKKLFWCFC